MSIVVRYSPQNMTAEQYDSMDGRAEEAGLEFPPEGLATHVCFGTDGDLRVSEIWDSREQFEAFAERLRPVLADAGIELSGEPEVYEVHRLEQR
jgi:hypothetical protein